MFLSGRACCEFCILCLIHFYFYVLLLSKAVFCHFCFRILCPLVTFYVMFWFWFFSGVYSAFFGEFVGDGHFA